MSKKECINSQRLEKLFTSNRDLTLSSNKKKNSQATENKKANRSRDFIPNLINPRIRAENVNTDIKKEETVKQKRNNKEKEDRFALKRGNNLIQTIGVFSEGIAAVSRQQRKYANESSRENINDESMHRPKLAKQENYFSKKSDEKILANLIGGDETEVCKSNIVSDSALNPIKIKKCGDLKEEPKDIIIKREPIDFEQDRQNVFNLSAASLSLDNQFSLNHQQPYTSHIREQDLMMFQFPDTLPGKMIENEEEKDAKPESSVTELHTKPKVSDFFSLHNLNEGLIGKLIRYRSGKMKFFLGESVKYDIDCGIPPAELQQHVTVFDTCIEEMSTNIYSLGVIKSKHVISPDWSSIWP